MKWYNIAPTILTRLGDVFLQDKEMYSYMIRKCTVTIKAEVVYDFLYNILPSLCISYAQNR